MPGAAPTMSLGEVLRVVLQKPTFYFLSLAFGGMVFATIGYMTWMPTFLYEKFHLSLKDAAFNSMVWHYLFAFVGVGGQVADIGDVHHMLDVKPGHLKRSPQHVLEDVGPQVADVGVVVDRGPTGVEADLGGRQRDEGLRLAAEGVVEV